MEEYLFKKVFSLNKSPKMKINKVYLDYSKIQIKHKN